MKMLPSIEIDLSLIMNGLDKVTLYPSDSKGYIVDLCDLSNSSTLKFRFDDNVFGVFNEFDIGFKMNRNNFLEFRDVFNFLFKHPDIFKIGKSNDYEMECSVLKLKQDRIRKEIKDLVLNEVLKLYTDYDIKQPLSLKML